MPPMRLSLSQSGPYNPSIDRIVKTLPQITRFGAASPTSRKLDRLAGEDQGPRRASSIEVSGGKHRLATAAVALLALAGVLLMLLDWQEVRAVLSRADWHWMPLALTITAVSYLCLSYSFASVNQTFNIQLDWRSLLGVGFVSSAMIAAIGGLAGHSLRLLLMTRRGLATGDVLAPSLFHSYLESLVFFALIPIGLGYLLLTHPLSPGTALWLGVGAGVLGLAFAATAVVFFYTPVRSLALRLVGSVWRWVARRDIGPSLRDFEATLTGGLAALRGRPLVLGLPVVLVLADRIARVALVWACFQALGSETGLGVIATGFAVGVAAGVMSMVPGGLGVQEGSMAGTYHLLGVPLEEAILVSVLFRAVYYMGPFVVSLAFYRAVLRRNKNGSV